MKDISPKWLLFNCICTGLVMFNTLFWPWAVTAERGDGPVGENPTISPRECFFLIFYSLSCPLSPSLFAPLPIVKPSTLLLQEWCNFHARFFLVKSICINIDLVFSLHPLPSTTTCFCYLPFVGLHYQTALVQHAPEEIFSGVQKVDCATISCLLHDAMLKAQRNEFPLKPRVRRAGNNSAVAPAAASASTAVAAVSVREMEREGVCLRVCVCELEWERVPMHCAERSWAVPSRGKLCVPVWFPCALVWQSLQKGEMWLHSELQHQWKISTLPGHHKSSMVGLETHCWHQREWWWQPTRGLPCATAALL